MLLNLNIFYCIFYYSHERFHKVLHMFQYPHLYEGKKNVINKTNTRNPLLKIIKDGKITFVHGL